MFHLIHAGPGGACRPLSAERSKERHACFRERVPRRKLAEATFVAILAAMFQHHPYTNKFGVA
jgi:hypothetical protein